MSRFPARWSHTLALASALLLGPAAAGPATAAVPDSSDLVHAASYPPGTPPLQLFSTVVCEGCTDTATMSGFKTGTVAVLRLGSPDIVLATGVADPGTVTVTFTIPRNVPTGPNTITLSGTGADGTAIYGTAQILTTAPATGLGNVSTGGLAETGEQLLLPGTVGAGVLGVGGIALFLVRRRSGSKPAGS